MHRIKKEICELQNIEYKPDIKVICPYCNKKEVEINRDKWHCKCGKKGDIMELLRLVEEDFIKDKAKYYYSCRDNKGVGY